MTRVLKEWRRWAAALCVGLVALIAFDQAAGLDGCHGGTPPALEAVFTNTVPTPSNAADGALPAQAHCCSAHAVSIPIGGSSALAANQSSQNYWAGRTELRAYDLTFALERPPRAVNAA